MAKSKTLISLLRSFVFAFVFAYAKCSFSHDAYICVSFPFNLKLSKSYHLNWDECSRVMILIALVHGHYLSLFDYLQLFLMVYKRFLLLTLHHLTYNTPYYLCHTMSLMLRRVTYVTQCYTCYTMYNLRFTMLLALHHVTYFTPCYLNYPMLLMLHHVTYVSPCNLRYVMFLMLHPVTYVFPCYLSFTMLLTLKTDVRN